MSASTALYLLDYVDLGGGETSFLAFIEEWLREVPAVRPVVVVPGEGPVGRALGELGVEARVIAYPRRLRRGPLPWFSLGAAKEIEALARRIQPSIIHANNFFGLLYAGLAAAAALAFASALAFSAPSRASTSAASAGWILP